MAVSLPDVEGVSRLTLFCHSFYKLRAAEFVKDAL